MCKIQYSESPLDIAAASADGMTQNAAGTVTGINAFDLGAGMTPDQGQVSCTNIPRIMINGTLISFIFS